MRNEITFLMELFIEDEIPKGIKTKIKERMSEITEGLMSSPRTDYAQGVRRATSYESDPSFISTDDPMAGQAPSMRRLMQQNPDIIPKPPQPITQAAAQALAARQALMHGAANEKPQDGRKSPRKI